MTDALDTQWTSAALNAYEARAQELAQTLLEHAALTAGRNGRQRELEPYFSSAERLSRAVAAFAEAELDWCGSSPVSVRGANDEEGDDEWEDDDEDDDDSSDAPVLSVLGRWDYRIVNPQILIQEGRAAYLTAWPDDTEDDAEVRVQTTEAAVRELLHAGILQPLEQSEGLDSLISTVELVTHAGTPEQEFVDDPFAILSPSSQ